MSVSRCICHQITFKEIKSLADNQEIDTFEELQFLKISSTKCKLCEPYIREMFKTGKTSFAPK